MATSLNVTVGGLESGSMLPDRFAFYVLAEENHITMGPNRSPHIAWAGIPPGTASYAIICRDTDGSFGAADINREDASIPASVPRADFYQWVLVDIPGERTELAEGADSDGVTGGGKPPGATDHGVRGLNDFTARFADMEQMEGMYGGYDGPGPPWNDERLHHYHFMVYALDVPNLALTGIFGGAETLEAMAGHVLASGEWVGTYTLNPALRAD